jgi:hypothetical protein
MVRPIKEVVTNTERSYKGKKKQPVLGYYTPTDNPYTAIWHM